MPSGGHARSGPPPDPNSFRSAALGAVISGGWIALTVPTEPAPAWPIGDATEEEAALWADLWSRPPASVWPTFCLTRDVATYVRTLLAFEHGGHSNAALGALVQRLADQLGLTVAGAQRNRWTYPAPPRAEGASVTSLSGKRTSSRDRFSTAPPASAGTPSDEDTDSPRDGSATDSRGRPRSSRERFRTIPPVADPA